MGFLDTLGKIGSAISTPLSAITGIGSSLISANSQKKANEANLRIAQMNNEWSERMMNKQHQYNVAMMTSQNQFAKQQAADANAFTEKMWNQTNEYNSAKNQAARLREAGLNPALVMSGQNAGTATGASGANGAVPSGNGVGLPSPSSATMQPVNYNGIGTAVNEAMQLRQLQNRTSAEVDWMNTQSDVARSKAAKEIADLEEQTRGRKIHNDIVKSLESTIASYANEQYLNALQNRLNGAQQERLLKQEYVLRRLQIEAFPEELSNRIAVMVSQRELNEENKKLVAKEVVSKALENSRLDYSKEQIERLKEAVVSSIEATIGQGWLNAGANAFGEIMDAVSTFGGKKAPKSYPYHTHNTTIYNNK